MSKFTISANGNKYEVPMSVLSELIRLIERSTGVMCSINVCVPPEELVNISDRLSILLEDNKINNGEDGFSLCEIDGPLSENDREVLQEFIEFLRNSDMACSVERR